MPHLGQSVLASIFSVCTLCLSTVWTIESFCRKREGKSEGFVVVVIVLGGWSGQSAASVSQSHHQVVSGWCLPYLGSRIRSSRT